MSVAHVAAMGKLRALGYMKRDIGAWYELTDKGQTLLSSLQPKEIDRE
jgi:hypothetical protein